VPAEIVLCLPKHLAKSVKFLNQWACVGFLLFARAHQYTPVESVAALCAHHAEDVLGWAVTGHPQAARPLPFDDVEGESLRRQRTSLFDTVERRLPSSMGAGLHVSEFGSCLFARVGHEIQFLLQKTTVLDVTHEDLDRQAGTVAMWVEKQRGGRSPTGWAVVASCTPALDTSVRQSVMTRVAPRDFPLAGVHMEQLANVQANQKHLWRVVILVVDAFVKRGRDLRQVLRDMERVASSHVLVLVDREHVDRVDMQRLERKGRKVLDYRVSDLVLRRMSEHV